MKRVNTQWTTAFAAAALVALPVAGWSQSASQPSRPTTPTTASPTAQQPPASGAHAEHGSAQEHVRQAKMALNDIPAASVPARAKSRLAELKRHVNALEKSSAAGTGTAGASASKGNARGKGTWATEVAAIDKILTELLGSGATGAAATGAQGTTGTTGAAGTAGSASGAASASATLDDTTRAKLMDVRTHITAFAGAMSGTGAASPAASNAPSASSNSAAAEAATQPSAASPTGAQPQSAGSPESTQAAGSQATQEQAAQQQGSAASAPAGQSAGTATQGDPEAASRHLTAARDSLSQLTQLPAAAQLQGEARTQVSQLISNFNELITTKTEWRAAYDKVNANITALLGSESTEGPAAQAQPQTGTAGAVGTSGSTSSGIDPAIRAKLLEFRRHMMEFEKTAGAGSLSSSASSGATPGSSNPGATGTSGSTAPSAGASPAPASSTATGTAGTTGATGSQSASQAQSGTHSQTATHGQSATGSSSSASGNQETVRHIEAIEAILNGRSGASATASGSTTGGATGTSGSASSVTLDSSQLEQIRMHLSQLRRAVEKK